MKALVKVSIFFVLISLFVGNASAQPLGERKREHSGDRQIEWLTRELDLTKEQQSKLKHLNLERRKPTAKMNALKEVRLQEWIKDLETGLDEMREEAYLELR
jgi:hypothetical protein